VIGDNDEVKKEKLTGPDHGGWWQHDTFFANFDSFWRNIGEQSCDFCTMSMPCSDLYTNNCHFPLEAVASPNKETGGKLLYPNFCRNLEPQSSEVVEIVHCWLLI
jgi:hypothetical protein